MSKDKPFYLEVSAYGGDARCAQYATFNQAEASAWRRAAKTDGGCYRVFGPGAGAHTFIAECGVDSLGRRFTSLSPTANFTLALSVNTTPAGGVTP